MIGQLRCPRRVSCGARPGVWRGGHSPTWAGGRTPTASAGKMPRAGGPHLQWNRSAGGGRGGGTSVGSRRCVRIFRITTGSSMVATMRMRPPQRAHANTSTPNVCRLRSGHDHLRAAGGGSSTLTVVAGSRLAAGVDDAGSPGPPRIITTGSPYAAPLASGRAHAGPACPRRRAARTPLAGGGAAARAAAAQPYYSLPCAAPATVVVGSTTYYQCGSTWYIRAYSGGDVAYTIVNPPAGY
jgi:hypothetical protein